MNIDTYLRRVDGILLPQDTRDMLRDQIQNAVDILEGVKDSLEAEHIVLRYRQLIIAEIFAEVNDGQ